MPARAGVCHLARMDSKLLGKIIVALIVVAGLVTGGTAWWGRSMSAPGPLQVETHVIIANGDTPPAMARKLAGAGVIASPRQFLWAVRAMRLAPTLKAGEYTFQPGISLRSTINKLALGDVEQRSVTIPEGWTVKQALERLKATDGLNGKAVAVDEGMLFPDTYIFHFGSNVKDVLAEMQKRMEQELTEAWNNRDAATPLTTPQDLLILASIVQKEAANEAEMPTIAGVFVNRLNKGMKLQSDPTVMYGADLVNNDIRSKDLREEQPFNTYVYAGLPPTPIANPGKAALMAAARPASTDALFFVADPSRTGHIFSKTYAEHQKYVKNYWTTLAREAKKAAKARAAEQTPATPPATQK